MSYIRIIVSYKLILYQMKVGNPYLMFVVYMNLSFVEILSVDMLL